MIIGQQKGVMRHKHIQRNFINATFCSRGPDEPSGGRCVRLDEQVGGLNPDGETEKERSSTRNTRRNTHDSTFGT